MSGARGHAGNGATGRGASVVDPSLVRRLCDSILSDARTRHLSDSPLPSREAVGELVEHARQLMFPGFFGRRGLTKENLALRVEELLAGTVAHAEEQIRAALRYVTHMEPHAQIPCPDSDEECDREARRLAREFVGTFPELRRLLSLDVLAAYEGDPAALHPDETIFCYPGVDAVFAHRVAHELYRLNVPLLPRIIQEMAHSRTGIDINPGARIGESFFIDHGGGVVIGETTVIGRWVRLYQGVTLGAKSIEKDARGRVIRGSKRHPTIGDRVVIYAGAVVLGGDTVIGDDCVIGGSVFITRSVPPGHVVRQNQPELILRSHTGETGSAPGHEVDIAH